MRSTYYGDYDYMRRVEDARLTRAARVRHVRHMNILITIGVLITMALCSFFSVKAFANTDNTSADSFGTKQYRSVVIYCGDTIDSIAEANYNSLYPSVESLADEIRNINNISDNEKLIPGNYIIVPYFNMASGY